MSTRRVSLNKCITRVYETCSTCRGKTISFGYGKHWETKGTGKFEHEEIVRNDKPDMGCCQSCNGSGETYYDEGNHDMQYGCSEIMQCTKCGHIDGRPDGINYS